MDYSFVSDPNGSFSTEAGRLSAPWKHVAPNSAAFGSPSMKEGLPPARLWNGAAGMSRFNAGVSPFALWMPWVDWSLQLASSPAAQAGMAADAASHMVRMGGAALGNETIAPEPGDHRFASPDWQRTPFHFFEQSFLLAQEWLDRTTTVLPGVSPASERMVNFAAHQWLDTFAPSNLPWLNPEVLAATWRESGYNLAQGFQNYLDDMAQRGGALAAGSTPDPFVPGKDVAVTPGKVVFRNDLIELLQYEPATQKVRAEPILIVPAWIMKYYVLDLSPHNSLIRYLTEQGHTVFCISWRNPGAEMRDVPFDAYRSEGLMAALDAVGTICPDTKVHACGYCLGGTLLTIAAAAMAREGDERLASVTLLAAQTDFAEPGELQLFTTEAQIASLEDMMAAKGYLDGAQMGSAFQLLRSRDLYWSRMIKTYWLGRRDQPNDLMAWNADATRMPARMHSEYLRAMYLRNDLAEGRYRVDGEAVSLAAIEVPFFVVSTETDHVAPWRSVYKIHALNPGEVTFALTSGGHNAGIVSEPGHQRRHFRVATRAATDPSLAPEAWLAGAQVQDGSWWPVWADWLAARSKRRQRPPPTIGASDHGLPTLGDAPGSYVLEH